MDETSERKRKRDEESDPSAPPSKQFGKKVWIETPKLVAIFKEIEEFAGKIELEKNEGATEDELTAFENETKMEIPKELRDLLKYSNGLRISYCLPLKKEEGEEKKGEGEGGKDEEEGEEEEKEEEEGDDSLWVPSVGEMSEHWSYNTAYPTIFSRKKALPFGMIDYDMCWNILNLADGWVWQVDGETNYMFGGCEGNRKLFKLEEKLEGMCASLKANRKQKPSVEGACDERWPNQVWNLLCRQWG
mmetsp:Transcript_26289/g.36596  ORF Transcript_26289/g.36596 Transcript_26289/m.36596 type:complete len:246 (-) Transcript_26289:95-832(-)